MKTNSPFSEETIRSMQDWYSSQYQSGYDEALSGKEYSGNTFIGYYGWLDGRAGHERKV